LASPVAAILPLGAGTHALIDPCTNLSAILTVLGRTGRVAVARHARAVHAAFAGRAAVTIATNLIVRTAARATAGSP
jgi:hypothetical protein